MVKKKIYIVVAALVLAVLFVALTAVGTIHIVKAVKNVYTMQIELLGDSEVTVHYGEKYIEPGAQARFYGTHFAQNPISVAVKRDNSVNDEVLGEYVLTYTATCRGVTDTVKRTVRVVDTLTPTITLNGDATVCLLPTEKYQEEGFSALDNYDGDVTGQVKRTETEDAITYTVTDSMGNVATVVRKIVYDDPIAPTLTLKGNRIITLNLGQKYVEPGYTATDNCDGDLTKKVEVKSKLDTSKAGYYTLKYTVRDSYNNTITASRIVRVKTKDGKVVNPKVVVPEGKVIYLTFDDGPGERTPELLDILKKYNVQATFFVVNTDYVDTIKRTAEEGHTLAIHTASHNYKKIYASESAFFKDLQKMEKIIKDLTGVETTLMRFPGGSSNTVSRFNRGIMSRLTKSVQNKGYQYFDWNVDSDDAGKASTPGEVYQNVIKGVKKRDVSIVLQHDTKGYSIDAVESIIIWGLHNGYTFLPLDPTSPGCHHGVNN